MVDEKGIPQTPDWQGNVYSKFRRELHLEHGLVVNYSDHNTKPCWTVLGTPTAILTRDLEMLATVASVSNTATRFTNAQGTHITAVPFTASDLCGTYIMTERPAASDESVYGTHPDIGKPSAFVQYGMHIFGTKKRADSIARRLNFD